MSLDKIRKNTYPMHDAVDLTVDDTDYPSVERDCMLESKFLILYDITETGVLVDGDRLQIRVQFREEGGTWTDYQNGPFAYLAEEESTTPCSKSVSGNAIGEKIRLVVTTDYTNATPANNYFTISTRLTLME